MKSKLVLLLLGACMLPSSLHLYYYDYYTTLYTFKLTNDQEDHISLLALSPALHLLWPPPLRHMSPFIFPCDPTFPPPSVVCTILSAANPPSRVSVYVGRKSTRHVNPQVPSYRYLSLISPFSFSFLFSSHVTLSLFFKPSSSDVSSS